MAALIGGGPMGHPPTNENEEAYEGFMCLNCLK